jgi:hypothetical protein
VDVVADGRFSDHAEDVTWLWPGQVQPDHQRIPSGRGWKGTHGGPRTTKPWWEQPAPRTRNGGGYARGPGYGTFFVHEPRDQRVLTKALVSPNHGPTTSWYKHGAYLDREGTQGAERGRGFDAQGNAVTMSTWLAGNQRDGDPHLFKVVLSPEHGERLDLPEFTRALLREVERDLGRPLEWAAIAHTNTSHPHVHLCIRGVSDGRVVTMARSYLHGGIHARAREVATRMLGYRLAPELEAAARRAATSHAWSELDTTLERKLSAERTVKETELTKWESIRLETLTERGLAWRVPGGWQLSIRWEVRNMRDNDGPPQEPAVEHDEEQGKAKPDREREADRERAQDAQQRRVTQIDDLEQDLGWER